MSLKFVAMNGKFVFRPIKVNQKFYQLINSFDLIPKF